MGTSDRFAYRHWYALFVKKNCEESVRKYIEARIPKEFGYYTLVPRRFLLEFRQGAFHKIYRKMFPGYVLIGTDNVKDLYKLICENEKVFKVLETDKEYSEVQYDEIFHILKMSDKKGAIGESELFVADDTVFVKSGPLLNFDGTIKKVDKRNKRSTIWFQFNGEPHEIQICTTVLTANSENDYARLKKIAVERKGTI